MTENTCSLCKHDHSKPYCLEHTSPGEQRSYCGCDGERYHDVDAPYRTLWHAVERYVTFFAAVSPYAPK